MITNDRDPLYVGYHAKTAARIARGVQRRLLVLGLFVVGSAVLLASAQRRAEPGVFEYGHPRSLHGQISEFPYPSLLVPGPSLTDREAAYTRYLLVAEGKHGAQSLVDGLDGQWVNLRGTRIARPGREMLEVPAGGATVTPPASTVPLGIPVPPSQRVGRLTLEGEIVDSKCWLGVMRPATGNVHRGCASRCLSGGIPPLLMTLDSAGIASHYLLTDAEGHPAHARFAELVGRRVRLTGEVWRDADLNLLRVEETAGVW
jgi:hypothetical protein